MLKEESFFQRPLSFTKKVRPEGRKRVRSLTAGVLLTSLIDAFSILVIYLLLNFSTEGQILYTEKGIELPVAVQSQVLERASIVKIFKDYYIVEDKTIKGANNLFRELVALKKTIKEKNPAVIIQADKKSKYKLINRAILASNQAGFSEIRFAVIQN